MILRTLAGAIRKQDWLTVVLEILIVVVGIVIGLQVDNWNQDRKDRASEQQYLARLHTDAIVAVERQRAGRDWNHLRIQTEELVLEAVRSGNLNDSQKAEFNAGLVHAGSYNPLIWHWGTVQELYATGNIELIRDSDLRNLISTTEVSYLWRFEIVNAAKTQALMSRNQIIRHFDPIEYEFSGDFSATVDFDFEAMASDREFIATFSNLHLSAKKMSAFSDGHLSALEEFEIAVARARGVESMVAKDDYEQDQATVD